MIKNIFYVTFFIFGLFLISSCTNSTNQESKKETTQEKTQETTQDNSFEQSKADYINKGMGIAKKSGKTLKGKLTAAVDKGGLKEGINTCNTIAQKLMDSLSVFYNADIKRTSLKLRNSKDKPDQDELAMLVKYNKMISDSIKLKPEVKQLKSGKVRFYAPIMIDKVCLNCHGKIGKNVKAENYAVIKKHYPNDEAIDYKEGDLRAIWSITFKK